MRAAKTHRARRRSSRSSTTWTSSSATRTGSSPSTRAKSSPTRRQGGRRPTSGWWTWWSAAGARTRKIDLMLAIDAIDVYIQASHILPARVARGRRARGRVPRRPERRRQDDHAAHGDGVPAAAARATITFRGERIDGRRTHEIAKLGVGWAPEDAGIFPDLTVAENIEIATWTRPGGRPASERIARAYEVFPVLRQLRRPQGPGDERRRAQDAVDRARPRARPRDAHPRRAVRGALAGDRARSSASRSPP